MIKELIDLGEATLHNNQMLSAGIGTVITGGVLVALREIPYTIYYKVKRFVSIEITLTTRHECYDDVIKLLNTKCFPFFTRNFSLTFYSDNSKGLIPGYGSSYGSYNGTIFHIQKDKIENKSDVEDQITVSFLTRNKLIIKTLIDEATEEEEFSKTIKVYVGYNRFVGPSHKSIPKRFLDTVFIDDDIKDKVMKRITDFLANEKWYTDRGIPYKLCILLYGKPGTGKTSFVKAIASTLNKNMSYVDSFDKLDEISDSINKNNIIVVEDADAIANLGNREDDSAISEKDTLQKVLNTLDGLSTPHGAIFIMTTNYIDKLDPALRRKGRIDISIEIKEVNKDTMMLMYKSFYGEECPDCAYTPKTGAELQDLFTTYNSTEVLTHLE